MNIQNSYSSRTKSSMRVNWISEMSQHLGIRLIQELLRIFFFHGFKNRLILILLNSRKLTTCNQPTRLKRVNTQFQLEDHISGIAVLVSKRDKSLIRINLNLQWNLSKAVTYRTEVFVRFRKVSTLERFELKSSQI